MRRAASGEVETPRGMETTEKSLRAPEVVEKPDRIEILREIGRYKA